jgi:hypothetical protein
MFSAAAAPLVNFRSFTARAAETPQVSVIDTHLHCFAGAEDRRYPYHAEAP